LRLIYNRDYLFKGIPKNKHDIYYKRVFEFAKDVLKEKDILSSYLIKKYSIKKMNGTKSIFKFDLSTSDAARCLIKYEDQDDQIFRNDPGIVLLQIASHDDQGEIGRRLDSAFIDYSKFFEFDEAIADDTHIEEILGREFYRSVYFYPEISDQDFLKLLLDDDSRYVYKPSERQYQAIHANKPILLLGCAGSGKTLVEISKSIYNAHSSIDQGYFTFTIPLKTMAEGIYNKYSSSPAIKGKTTFNTIHEFCLDFLNLRLTDYFNFERYKEWIRESKIKMKYKWIEDVGIINLWIEIRGLLKGYIGSEHFRNLEIKNADQIFNNKQFDEIIRKGFVEQDRHFKNTLQIIKSKELFNYINQFHELRNKMFHHDFDSPMIDKHTYINLKDEYSRFSKDLRNKIYDFVENVYQKYLLSHNLYDDNDLARLSILNNYGLHPFLLDFVLVDEVQDLSEMQIYMLVNCARDPGSVLLSGDVSQVINPTFFHKGRIGLMLRNRKQIPWDRENVLTLNENYRNSQSIVEIANKIIEIRQEILGTYTDDIVEISRQLEQSEGLPALIDAPEKSLFEALIAWKNAVKVAIIVSNDESKKALIKKMNLKREETYHIFTVQEAKGQEFDKVLIYNILSDYSDEWNLIMNSSKKDSSIHFQYYFNLLYVAITRAKRNLYIFEDNKDLNILKQFSPYLDNINDDIIHVLDPDESISTEQIIKQAEEFFIMEDYERARYNYMRISDRKNALICLGYQLIQQGKFFDGVKILYRYSEHRQYAYKYTNEKDTLLYHILIGYQLKHLDERQIDSLLNNRSLIDLVSNYKDDRNYDDLLSRAIRISTRVKDKMIRKRIEEIINEYRNAN
jgi:superfamily I DNA/RNA helicase